MLTKWLICGLLMVGLVGCQKTETTTVIPESKLAGLVSATPMPSLMPSPTPRPMTLAEMNDKYGPCIKLPVLMYHHIQTKDQAVLKKQTGLSVYTDIFKDQMDYLKSQGYTTVLPGDLGEFFDSGKQLPAKSVLITVDDGYADNYTDMYPILKANGQKATVFLATGLMENPDYLSWAQIGEMKQAGIFFANHTWSHSNVKVNLEKLKYEIATAQTQLEERGLGTPKVFAYPYGIESNLATAVLNDLGFKIAFDTKPGNIACEKNRLFVNRYRVGNVSLKGLGF